MSDVPSFERFDYLLRTNKHIERKLVFDILWAGQQRLDLQNLWYLGFGSMWFGDFRLAHRILGIDDLVSIELDEHANRANFNIPYSSVKVEPGECSDVLQKFTAEKWVRPVIGWLDYDGRLDKSVVEDVERILSKCATNSVLLVTVNASRNNYRVRGGAAAKDRAKTAVGVVEQFLGSASIPARFQPKRSASGIWDDVEEDQFPNFFAEAVLTHMQHRMTSLSREVGGKRLRFFPLFNFHHRDGADMITVGGAICSDDDAAKWGASLAANALVGDASGKPIYQKLNMIPMTVKEKLALDRCLPFPELEQDYFQAARDAGIVLDEDVLRKYKLFYRHFPVFVETYM
jgi:hypothetical protein